MNLSIQHSDEHDKGLFLNILDLIEVYLVFEKKNSKFNRNFKRHSMEINLKFSVISLNEMFLLNLISF